MKTITSSDGHSTPFRLIRCVLCLVAGALIARSIGPETADDSALDPDAIAYLRENTLGALQIPRDPEYVNELEAEYT